jgi:hypothetical protein
MKCSSGEKRLTLRKKRQKSNIKVTMWNIAHISATRFSFPVAADVIFDMYS